MPRRPDPDRLELAGRTMLRHRFGPRDGRPFVLIHGIGCGLDYWLRLVPVLAAHGPVHVVELPGFGRAPKPARALAIEELADHVVDLLESIGRPVVLVGQSMGTQVVLEAALRVPDRIDRLVAIGAVTDDAERTAALQGLRLLQDVLSETPGANVAVFRDYLRCGPRRYLATLPSMLGYDTEAATAAVTVPTLLVRGAGDPICRRPWARRLAARLGVGGLVEIPGAVHNAQHTHPRAVASAILSAPLEPRP
ncbi:alpha/beta fold hydrolase [Amnibacterium kyonggiense]|uniref:Pimeloyl-ACP methyl ester carboxylesterase n=1 Tax=Amnibacterium kyonggiense TaxID=595671 RepID=A0A4R7FRT6_9MICO|nr:alpha/beta hydrolase [Amnibacterium kyonggiense]TDS80448.1 pimeloyl-ACP methyl ester carboxylesterase [Amnibacterium kyonggiense]